MRESKPAFAVAFDGVVEDVVYLHHAVVREGAIGTRDVGHGVAASADITGARTVLEATIGRTTAFILHWGVVDGVVGSAGKFIDVIGNLDGEAIV